MTAARFFDGLHGKRIGFVGVGVSHRRLIEMFLEKGLQVLVCDKKSEQELGEAYETLSSKGAHFSLGEEYLSGLESCDVIFRTPGMYFYLPVLTRLREMGKVVTSEMEVFFDLCPCKKYAVTGSDGKTTTTTLISEFFKAAGRTVHLGGNIGRALLPEVERMSPDDIAVVELSSFQLISMRTSPDVAVVTNVAPNHLDVHKDMEEYIAAKENLIRHQNAFSRTVLNIDNEITREMGKLVRGVSAGFSRCRVPDNGAYLAPDGMLCYNSFGSVTQILHKDEIRLPGIHNVENYLAAITATWGEVPLEAVRAVARQFGGVEHRIEFVRELDGVRWYNDSIATSPTRTIAGLNSFDQKLIVIAGGYDKKIPFEPLAPKILEKVKVLILTGLTADKIERAVTQCDGYAQSGLRILRAQSMEDAVQIAYEQSQSGDIVSLSPACASFDCYPNFEARGRHFKALVQALVSKES